MTYLTLFWTFFKIGLFTFGGGYAMLPLIQQYVLGFGWLSEEELVNFVAVSESTPGPFAINNATYVGSSQAGVPGAFFTTLGVVLPSFIIILIVAKCYTAFKESLVVRGMMNGLKPVVVGLIGSAVISFALAVFFPAGFMFSNFATLKFWVAAVLFAAALIMALKKVHPIIIILISAVIGIIIGYAGLLG